MQRHFTSLVELMESAAEYLVGKDSAGDMVEGQTVAGRKYIDIGDHRFSVVDDEVFVSLPGVTKTPYSAQVSLSYDILVRIGQKAMGKALRGRRDLLDRPSAKDIEEYLES